MGLGQGQGQGQGKTRARRGEAGYGRIKIELGVIMDRIWLGAVPGWGKARGGNAG